jgi:hypothetical protein
MIVAIIKKITPFQSPLIRGDLGGVPYKLFKE